MDLLLASTSPIDLLWLFASLPVSQNTFFCRNFLFFFVTAVDHSLQFNGCQLMVYFWGMKVTSITFNSCSQLFNLPCCLLRCFRCCHHIATTPRNVCTTKETRHSSGTPLNSKTSSTANIQYQNSEGCNSPGNSGILSLNPSTYQVALACAWC
jgi:hypothetical protein